ncbi:hypothetical protein THMIRHAS_01240 [Thiosulfatimonas sediminis]|uniref:Uroporphyrinogen-III synthase n=1 Tax=Thiosulfatimonas sediminis TaxID=2675054 RepID=A0A6F8PRJ9_9GAMM|nr:uroporphyrinogen-III synthase [Thiosulfatimonas sediminis]BBP44751.1 hypothetical protein THMIRHAS_01240 [Thiosulfatimonas sediminis]
MLQLADLTFLNTRPAQQAQPLTQLLQQNTVQVLECPTLRIALLDEVALASPVQTYDMLLFTSVNALRGWQQNHLDVQFAHHQTLIAIGKATADYGLQLGWPIAVLAQQHFDSESLLAHPQMQDLSGQKILLVKGQGGRDKLPTTLRARGAVVTALDVYKRQPASYCASSWPAFRVSQHPVLLISSYDSFCGLNAILDVAEKQVLSASCAHWDFIELAIVFSQRIADKMRAAGWQRPISVIPTQSNQGVLDALRAYLAQRHAE